jgi:hypothetical protein
MKQGIKLANNSLGFNNPFAKLFSSLAVILATSMAGMIGSLASGTIFGFIAGIILEIFYFTSDGMGFGSSVMAYASAAVITMSIPFGALIGLVTGTHFAIFRLFRIHSFVWAMITCISAIAGLWFSSSHAPSLFQDITLYLLIAIISLATGWTAHRYATTRQQYEKEVVNNLFLPVVGSISSAVIISLASLLFFGFMEYLRHIPS